MIIGPGAILKDNEHDFQLGELIAPGGFSHVYKAKKLTTNEIYAIKTIQSSFASDEDMKSFNNEIKLASQIVSPNIIKYFYTHDGTVFNDLPPYIIMEYADGGTLEKLIEKQKLRQEFFKNSELVTIFTELIDGMIAINKILIHRDIKPSNILVVKSKLKISDFGLSKVAINATRSNTFKGYGTFGYIAPEAWDIKNKNTKQMDIYSMGIVFHEIASLSNPYSIKNLGDFNEWYNAHLFQPIKDPTIFNKSLSSNLALLILRMLEKSTNKRFSNWEDIKTYLLSNSTKDKNSNDFIESMLNSRLKIDTKKQKEETDRIRKKKEKLDFYQLVNYQFKESIIYPIKELIEKFNSDYPSGNIIMQFTERAVKENSAVIKFMSEDNIKITLSAITEDDYKTIRHRDIMDRSFEQIRTPMYKERNILAWGGLYTDDKRGFNILLVEDKNEIYGEFFIMENTCSALSSHRRPEPFGFSYEELFKEILHINSSHIYQSKIVPFDLKWIMEFIYEYNKR